MELGRPPSGAAERPGSVLLLEDSASNAGDRLCGELLASEGSEAASLVVVTLVDTPAERLAVWDEITGGRPVEAVVVAMTNVAHAERGDAGAGDGTASRADVRTISNPGNLTRLGVTITEALADLDGSPPVVCFHSLSVLLQYAPVEQVFQFLSVLKTHLDAADAVAHFHLDPASHEERTVATLRPLFDEVVRANGP